MKKKHSSLYGRIKNDSSSNIMMPRSGVMEESMLRPTFSGFQVAKLGLSASQKLLDITGQNITNINTDGYTRQRVDLYSIAHSSGSMKYASFPGGIGRGVGDLGASQIRDPFLDIRYRNEAAKVGKEGILGDALSDLENIFGEISKDGLDSQFSNFISQLQALSASPSDPVIEGVVKTAASMITQLFNHYSKQLDTVKEQQITYLEDGVNETNKILTEIANLNKQIKDQNIHGDKALELNDRRNTLIDELSTYMNIEVKRTSQSIGNGREVEVLSIISKDINDGGTPPKNLVLIDGNDFAQIKLDKSDDKNIKVILDKSIDASFAKDLDITSQIEKGQISGYLSFLNNKAEFTNDTNFTTQDRGIQYYQGMLDKLANTFASMFNDANTSNVTEKDGEYYTSDGNKLQKDGSGNYIDSKGGEVILDAAGVPEKVKYDLFDGGTTITASNIKISEKWKNTTESYIVNTNKPLVFKDDGTVADNSAANDNIMNMISLFSKKVDFTNDFTTPTTGSNFLFKGTLQECLSFTSSTLDVQIKNTKSLYESYGETLVAIDTSRSSISGVSLDEEGINLLTYNKSYSAAARLMTTLDEALNTLINNTGRVGL